MRYGAVGCRCVALGGMRCCCCCCLWVERPEWQFDSMADEVVGVGVVVVVVVAGGCIVVDMVGILVVVVVVVVGIVVDMVGTAALVVGCGSMQVVYHPITWPFQRTLLMGARII